MQETRRWDDDCGVSRPMRSKEDAQDYRYFPEPDLSFPEISESLDRRDTKAAQPQMRKERAERFQKEFYLPAYDAPAADPEPSDGRQKCLNRRRLSAINPKRFPVTG